jgi:hypothetical protein
MVLALLLLLAGSPALAGLRAIYNDAAQSRQLIIDVADNGDARIGEAGSTDYGLLLAGQFYMVGREDGVATVARIEDVAAAIDTVVPPIFKDIFSAAPTRAPAAFRAGKKGSRTVAGRTGTVYAVYGLNDEKPKEATEFVMSEDPDLKPIGRALEQFMNAAILPGAVFIGPAAAEIVAQTRAIFALGTPLDGGGRFTFAKIETVKLNHEALELPAKPKTVEELVAAMAAGRPQGTNASPH